MPTRPRNPRPARPERAAREARPRLRKALGQHHLRSGSSCRPLIDFLAPAGRYVVEVGPGGGVLTRELLAAGARVLALELDPEWAETLRRQVESPDLEVRVEDALEFAWSALPPGTLVAGNLPYNVGTAIVERVLKAHPPIDRAAFLLQREVVDRMTAKAGDKAYGALSVLVQLRADVRRLGLVRPGAFVPPPKVDSAFVGLKARSLPPEVAGEQGVRFERWLREAFSKRRKTLANALGRHFPKAEVLEVLKCVRKSPSVRAEALSIAELIRVFLALTEHRGLSPSPLSAQVES